MGARLLVMVCLFPLTSFAAGKVLLTATTRVGLREKFANDLLTRVQAELMKEGLTTRQVTQSCDGERACLVELGKNEAHEAVVAVSLVMSVKSIVVDLEGVSVASGTVLGQTNFKLKNADAPFPESVTTFARGLGQQLEAEKKARQLALDAPVKPVLEPAEMQQVEVVPLAAAPTKGPVMVTSIAAGAALIAAVVLFGVGASQQAQLPPRESMLPPLAPERAQQLIDGANTAYTGAGIAGGAAGGLAVTAFILGVTSK
ncbi:MAG: hypothetical protein Q8K32_13755 [Archangium sp.]|nr:hypothetical protein [Archangium sp.]